MNSDIFDRKYDRKVFVTDEEKQNTLSLMEDFYTSFLHKLSLVAQSSLKDPFAIFILRLLGM